MTQKLEEVSLTDYIDEGLNKLLNRDLCALTSLSGDSFPERNDVDLIHNNTSEKVIYHSNGSSWEKLIDYKSVYETEHSLSKKYQPLNKNLTDYSSVFVNQQGFICKNKFQPMSNYFKSTLSYLTSTTAFSSTIKLGKIAYLKGISNVYIKENSITKDKLSSDITTDSPFKPGDVCMSFNKNGKKGFLKMSNGLSVGNSASGANYTGEQFKELFAVCWKRSDLNLMNLRGVVVSKSSSWEIDWNTSCRMSLPQVPNRFNATVGATIYESSVGGSSGTFNVPLGGYYDVTVIGAGGGGYAFNRNYSKWWSGCAAGGSGAVFSGVLLLRKGTWNVKVGLRGNSQATSNDGVSKSTAGGDTTIINDFYWIVGYGGKPGVGADKGTTESGFKYAAGEGGGLYHPTTPIHSTRLFSSGRRGGGYAYGTHLSGGDFKGGESSALSIGLNYGWGGSASSYSGGPSVTQPGDGYVKVSYAGYYEPNSNNSNNIDMENFYKSITFYIKY